MQAVELWVMEETSGHLRRKREQEESADTSAPISIRVYSISGDTCELAADTTYAAGSLQQAGVDQTRAHLAIDLLREAGVATGVVVANHRLGGAATLCEELRQAGLEFMIEVPPQTEVRFRGPGRPPKHPAPVSKLRNADWQPVDLRAPHSSARYYATHVGPVEFGGNDQLHCVAVSTGGIKSYRRGLLVGLTSLSGETPLEQLSRLLVWTRWVRPFARRASRNPASRRAVPEARGRGGNRQAVLDLPVRANLQIARQFDERHAEARSADLLRPAELRGGLARGRGYLNVVELFAGAGGMGLGFLLAESSQTRYRIVHSAEVHPAYVETLRHNHRYAHATGLCSKDATPSDPLTPQDLRSERVAHEIVDRAATAGGTDILIGGPPCQGFSNANRNSWSSSNPNNQLVETFLDYVKLLQPKILLMENVQGILWTPQHDRAQELSVATHVASRLTALGYRIYPKLLDAAWYGVPQHRNRFFLLGVHSDLGYAQEDLGFWGPYPLPRFGPGTERKYVTVRDAIADLPPVGNGAKTSELPYTAPESGNWFLSQMRRGAPAHVIWDHITSRHADYVIDRYRRIPPGGNWEDVAEMMTNYADVSRTHSNIYRRIEWEEPAITIGHYRKSMIIHPAQHRGLSLREAARLQSFPDWFRFAGSENGLSGGLTHKQQQLANAVCPLVTKAVAEYLLCL